MGRARTRRVIPILLVDVDYLLERPKGMSWLQAALAGMQESCLTDDDGAWVDSNDQPFSAFLPDALTRFQLYFVLPSWSSNSRRSSVNSKIGSSTWSPIVLRIILTWVSGSPLMVCFFRWPLSTDHFILNFNREADNAARQPLSSTTIVPVPSSLSVIVRLPWYSSSQVPRTSLRSGHQHRGRRLGHLRGELFGCRFIPGNQADHAADQDDAATAQSHQQRGDFFDVVDSVIVIPIILDSSHH